MLKVASPDPSVLGRDQELFVNKPLIVFSHDLSVQYLTIFDELSEVHGEVMENDVICQMNQRHEKRNLARQEIHHDWCSRRKRTDVS